MTVNEVLDRIPWRSGRRVFGDAWMSPACYPKYVEMGQRFKPHSILEIGTFEGYGLIGFWMGAGPDVERIEWVDTERDLSGSNAHCIQNLKAAADLIGWHLPDMAYAERAETLPYSGPHDLIHVDGNHSFLACLTDMVMAWHRKPKVMLVDDYDYAPEPGVRKAVDLFSDLYGLKFEHVSSLRGWALFQ